MRVGVRRRLTLGRRCVYVCVCARVRVRVRVRVCMWMRVRVRVRVRRVWRVAVAVSCMRTRSIFPASHTKSVGRVCSPARAHSSASAQSRARTRGCTPLTSGGVHVREHACGHRGQCLTHARAPSSSSVRPCGRGRCRRHAVCLPAARVCQCRALAPVLICQSMHTGAHASAVPASGEQVR